jgi:hypothetical protein
MGLKNAELGCKRWSVIIAIDEQDDGYRARAELYRLGKNLIGVGHAPLGRRSSDTTEKGDELAAARALMDLADQLFAQGSVVEVTEQSLTATQ